MPLCLYFQSPLLLETITTVFASIFGGLLGVALIIFMIIFIQKRQKRKLGESIEEEIDIKAKYYLIRKEAQKAKLNNNYRKSIIFNAFVFRIICQEMLTVRNGRTIPIEELVEALKGTPKLDTRKIKTLFEIYEKARYTADDISYDDSKKVEVILNDIIQSLNIDTENL
ncbi:MAG: hypothetical protein ACTSP7_12520 [Candidatus Heimdallarchaeota archaeon]